MLLAIFLYIKDNWTMRYIALLRGINVGGNNKVSMSELNECFQSLGFKNVMTYINSGNVIFDDLEPDVMKLIRECERVIEERFGFRVVCTVTPAKELEDALSHAPDWWGLDNADKHNVIFVIPPLTPAAIMKEVGETKPEYEKIASSGQVIFWTAPLKTFGRTRYGKIVGTAAYKFVTIRNGNTVKKLVELSR
jgi:uncharacterized protein (DUF1697 family)